MAKAGVITIDVNAGTAQFLVDMDKANARLQQFGRGATDAGHQTVTSMQASSAAIRLLENPMGNNIRAVERFIGLLPGMGNLLKVAFPVVGAIAFGDLLGKLGGEAVEFFRKIEQAPERIAGAFRELNAPLQLTNDELALANDRLKNDIAKLEGKPQNGLAIALDEARVAADRLADSLAKDIGNLDKLIRQEDHGVIGTAIRAPFGGGVRIDDISKELGGASGFGGFRGRLADAAGDPAKSAQMLDQEISKFEALLSKAQGYKQSQNTSRFDERIEILTEALRNLRGERTRVSETQENASLSAKRDQEQAARENAEAAVNALRNLYAQQLEALKASHQVTLGEELRFWQIRLAQTAGQGKAYEALHREIANTVGRLSQETEKLFSGESLKLRTEENRKSAEQIKKFNEEMAKSAEEAEKLIEESNKRIVEATEKAGITRAKETERRGVAGVESQRLSTDRARDLQLVHTPADEVNAIRLAADYQARITALKIQALKAEADALDGAGKVSEAGEKRAEAEDLSLKAANDRYEAETRIAQVIQDQNQSLQARKEILQTIADWSRIGLGTFERDFARAGTQVPGAIGSGIANAAFDGKADFGRQITDALKNVGRNLLGELVTQAIEKLIAELGIHIATTATAAASTQALIASNTALGVAIAANTAALGVSGGASAAGGIASGVGSAAGAASSVASAASSATLVGPLISAAGGIIGGVISAVATWIGDNKIVKAVNATTAAVLSLKGNTNLANPNLGNGLQKNSQQNQQQQGGGGFGIGGFLQGFFGLPDSQAVPVRIVKSWGDALGFHGGLASALTGIFTGFADGTNSAPGGWSWVGEKGPELMYVPRGASIIPNHELGGFAMPADYMTAGGRPASFGAGSVSNSYGHTFSGDIHMYGVQDVREFMREISSFDKTQNPARSPFGN